ncbi:MAG: transglutaminase-like domain-containing protein [Nanoarchaeota archaeon]|nr:transglutaminase-like domain-containing protein [Nanoarchaeota archaeon]
MDNTLEFEYHALELLQSDAELAKRLGEELVKERLNIDEISNIIKQTEKMDPTIASRKVKHAVENQFSSAKEAIREIAVQNTIDAYFDLENFLTKRNEKINYPLKVDVTCTKKGQDVYDLEIRDYATGMNLYDVLYKYFTIGDTSKQDKSYHIGGHGRGAKAGLHFCKKLSVESFGKRTIAQNKDSKYTITVGEDSGIREGTKITLEDLIMKEDPFLALKEFAGKITTQFDFEFNGIKVNQKDDSKELGKLPLEEKKKIKGTDLELTDLLLASSKNAEGLELKQSVMTVFEKPIDIEYVKRTIGMPTGYLLSRSRNEIPKPVQDVLENKGDKVYKKFFKHLYGNLSKIGAYEFRFMDSFSKRKDTLSKIVSGSYKIAKNSALAFMVGASLFLSAEYLAKPAFNEIAYYLSSNRNFSNTKFFSKVHRPIADVQEFIIKIFGGSRFFSKIRKNPLGYYYVEKEELGNNYYTKYYIPGGDVFFKLTSYNRMLSDGSWDNFNDSFLDIKRLDLEPKKATMLIVHLNLDAYKKKSVLPVPTGYRVWRGPEMSSVWESFYPSDDLPYDTFIIKTHEKPKGEFPIRYEIVKTRRLVKQFEKDFIDAETEFIREKFTNVPFKIIYPEDLEEKLKRIDNIKLTEKEKVDVVTDIIREHLTYNTSSKNHVKYLNMNNVVNDPLKSKHVDCDVANGILGAILRDRYKIPTRLAVGIQGVNGVLKVDAGHGVCEAYIKGEGWTVFDATPSETSPDMFKAAEGPSRFDKFLDWIKGFLGLDKVREEKDVKEEVVNDYTKFSPTSSWFDKFSLKKYFRKTLYYGGEAVGFVFNNYPYFLLGLGGASLFGAYRYWKKRKETDLKNIPLVDIWSKEELGKAFEEKISINQGMNYTKKGELLYDKQVVENGLEKLANSEYENGKYVLDYNFYNTIIDMSGSKNTRMYYKKEDEERVINPTILKSITFGDETLKEKNSEEKISEYSNKINALQCIVTGICKANKISNVQVSAEYKFKNQEKILSFKNSMFKPKVYVNIEHPFIEKDPAAMYLDEKLLDSLIFATALATEHNIGELNELKKNYLNKVVLGEQK